MDRPSGCCTMRSICAAAVATCLSPGCAAPGGSLTWDPPQRLATCEAIPDASGLDPLHRPGIAARRCGLAPDLRLAILMDDTVAWPIVEGDRTGPVDLEDPVARRLWFDRASPLRVSFQHGELFVLRDRGRAPQAAYYSAFADRTDERGKVDAFVVVRIRPWPCLLGVVRERTEARRLAQDEGATCKAPVAED